MPNRLGRFPTLLHFFVAFLALTAACSVVGEPVSTPSPSPELTPYRTPSLLTPLSPSLTPDSEEIEQPTPSPFLYTIITGDTVFNLAASFGISQDAILAANPGLDPRLLSPGTEIVIPVGEGGELVDVVPTPTPLAVELRPPDCYTDITGRLTCFLSLSAIQQTTLENVTAVIRLFSDDGKLLASIEAIAPLNLIPPGAFLPLIAYLPNSPEGWVTAQSQLLTAYQAIETEERYIDVQLSETDVDIEADGIQAVVRGSLSLDQEAGLVWVLAVAYDEEDRVVGVRRWQAEENTKDFEFWVYSLGPEIWRVELFAEARP
jgi:LysM repeat protein